MVFIKFPKNFIWGAATSAYQVEGACNEDGRGPSVWDVFSHIKGKIKDNNTGDIACDSYHRYQEDVNLLKRLGANAYRFSVSWPRIFPKGLGTVNEKGLAYYRKLVDQLVANNIEPMCTLYHWDLPQALQDNGGWMNRKTVDAFVEYASLVFKEFDGKIKFWLTFNEPWCVSFVSNYMGVHAPGNKDLQLAIDVAHNVMVAHGKTVQTFRNLGIKGQIGYAPNLVWNEPYSTRQEDVDACKRNAGWFNEWFLEPVFKGTYPQFLVDWFKTKGVSVRATAGDMETIRQPIDFLGINYYSGTLARYKESNLLFDAETVDEGYPRTDIEWGLFYPQGLYKLLTWVKDTYGSKPIFITENGACYKDVLIDGKVHDEQRIEFLKRHLIQVDRALKSGMDVKGYFAWSLLDNFEWAEGYTKRFGLVYTDFKTLKRLPKDSFHWYKKVIDSNSLEA